MTTVQSYTKAGVDNKMASRSNMTLAYSGAGTPELTAFPDAKTGDIIERSSDRAQWRVLGNTLAPLGLIVTKVNGQTGEVTITASGLNASPTGHKHTIADISDLTVSKTVTADHVVQRTTDGNITVPTTPNANTSAASKSYVDSQVSGAASDSHKHTKSDITDLETISTTVTVNHIVKRTTDGNIAVPTTPSDVGSATSKSYVDAEVGKKANTSHTHTKSNITDLETISTGANADHVVKRINSGNITVPATPNAATSATSKSYVDAEVTKKANTSHTHTKSNITDLETISTGATGNHIVKRNTDGNITVPATPATTTSATSKSYVDAEVTKKANTSHKHIKSDITDLETISTGVSADHIVKRETEGDILVPLTPAFHNSAASKNYVDISTPWFGTRTQYNAINPKVPNRPYVILGA